MVVFIILQLILINVSNKLQCYLITDLTKLFWYPIHVEWMVRNGNSISMDVLEDITVVLDFLTWQDNHNICTLSVNVKFILHWCETFQKSFLFYLFIKLLQINLIFSNNVHIPVLWSSCHVKMSKSTVVSSNWNTDHLMLNNK